MYSYARYVGAHGAAYACRNYLLWSMNYLCVYVCMQVRYREGQVVSSKGEKFIVEKLQEEWDGGSTGKVFTKGKRGKGFV